MFLAELGKGCRIMCSVKGDNPFAEPTGERLTGAPFAAKTVV
jgi:hypothetical protein